MPFLTDFLSISAVGSLKRWISFPNFETTKHKNTCYNSTNPSTYLLPIMKSMNGFHIPLSWILLDLLSFCLKHLPLSCRVNKCIFIYFVFLNIGLFCSEAAARASVCQSFWLSTLSLASSSCWEPFSSPELSFLCEPLWLWGPPAQQSLHSLFFCDLCRKSLVNDVTVKSSQSHFEEVQFLRWEQWEHTAWLNKLDVTHWHLQILWSKAETHLKRTFRHK